MTHLQSRSKHWIINLKLPKKNWIHSSHKKWLRRCEKVDESSTMKVRKWKSECSHPCSHPTVSGVGSRASLHLRKCPENIVVSPKINPHYLIVIISCHLAPVTFSKDFEKYARIRMSFCTTVTCLSTFPSNAKLTYISFSIDFSIDLPAASC